MNKNLKITALLIMISLISFNVNAQLSKKVKKSFKKPKTSTPFNGCTANLVSKTGEVFSVAPGILTARPTSDEVTIRVKKTGGRAKTTVNIYVNNSLKKRMIFENGRDFPKKERTITGVKGKNIKVELVNQSVGNSFKYNAQIIGKRVSYKSWGLMLFLYSKTFNFDRPIFTKRPFETFYNYRYSEFM